jgi:hypothetical protein
MTLLEGLKTWAKASWPADLKRPPDGEWSDKWTAAVFRVRCRIQCGWVTHAVIGWPLEVIRLGPLIGKVVGAVELDQWPPGSEDWRDAVRGFSLYELTLGTGSLTPEGITLGEDLQREILAANSRAMSEARTAAGKEEEAVPAEKPQTWAGGLF